MIAVAVANIPPKVYMCACTNVHVYKGTVFLHHVYVEPKIIYQKKKL